MMSKKRKEMIQEIESLLSKSKEDLEEVDGILKRIKKAAFAEYRKDLKHGENRMIH
ncbi:hypothetical protein [Bacillus cereus]|uniref:hypothetical protein n=1 Tax=Bacillus cereus TaxID=1396 RepID=UPI00159B9BB0|nr:hypothetical protein [Bacillus cereus]